MPAPFSEALFDAAPEPKESWFAPDAGHVNLDGFGALDAVVAFIERRGALIVASLRGARQRSEAIPLG